MSNFVFLPCTLQHVQHILWMQVNPTHILVVHGKQHNLIPCMPKLAHVPAIRFIIAIGSCGWCPCLPLCGCPPFAAGLGSPLPPLCLTTAFASSAAAGWGGAGGSPPGGDLHSPARFKRDDIERWIRVRSVSECKDDIAIYNICAARVWMQCMACVQHFQFNFSNLHVHQHTFPFRHIRIPAHNLSRIIHSHSSWDFLF